MHVNPSKSEGMDNREAWYLMRKTKKKGVVDQVSTHEMIFSTPG
jgi:hypothetical protein